MFTAIHIVGLPAAYSQIVFPFNTQQEFVDNFAEAGHVPSSQYIYSISPGVGAAPGRIDATGVSETLFLKLPTALALNISVAVSTYFLYNEIVYDPGRQGNPLYFNIGFANSIATDLRPTGTTSAGPAYFAFGMVVGDAGGVQRKLIAVSKLGVETSVSPVYSTNFSMHSGWYEMAGEWTLLSSNTFGFTGQLVSRGQDGTDSPALVSSLTTALANADLAALSHLFAGISLRGAEASCFDNVSVVPEPTSLLLLLIALSITRVFHDAVSKRCGTMAYSPIQAAEEIAKPSISASASSSESGCQVDGR